MAVYRQPLNLPSKYADLFRTFDVLQRNYIFPLESGIDANTTLIAINTADIAANTLLLKRYALLGA